MVGVEYQTNYNIPLSQSLIQTKAVILLSSLRAERGQETAEESLKLAEVG